jgi:hypothetical protein
LAGFVLAPAYAQNETCEKDGTTANCTDVPTSGIRYHSGTTDINVDDGEEGATDVTPGRRGIELYLYGSTGDSDIGTIPWDHDDDPDTDPVQIVEDFETILWDTDEDPDTDPVEVLSANGTDPLLVGGEYIFPGAGDPPETFTVGAETYTGEELAALLAEEAVIPGGSVTGFLTINNDAPFTTTNAGGIAAVSQGGHGGSGSCWTILFIYTHCNDGKSGGGAGSVAVNNNAAITVNGTTPGSHGIVAISQGGRGGKGGEFIGAVATAGGGGDGGHGGDVSVMLGLNSDITTNSPQSHGVFARSRGGDGGAAGWIGGLVAFGDSGGNGGDAGIVTVDNYGRILTTGWNSHGILAQSVGAGGGSGSSAGGIYAEGGSGGGESFGADVTVNNFGTIETQHSDSYGILAQSIGGGGGDGGGAGGWFTVGGRGGSGGGSGVVEVNDSGTVKTSGDRSTAIFAQSIGGGGGNGGDAVSFAETLSVAIGGNGGLGGDGHNVEVTTEGSDIDTGGDDAHGIHAQSIGGGGGNGGLAIAGTMPSGSPINVSVALGGAGGTGGDAGETVKVTTSADTTIDTAGARSHGIAAQSIGGGGGNGGTSLAGSVGSGLSVAVSIGGSGGAAGNAKTVIVDNSATITTLGDLSAGIFTQSVGGGGGSGGFSGSLAVGGLGVGVSIGGDGSAGGLGGKIDVDNFGMISTFGHNAAGIFAQSIGGSGGNGGSALALSGGLGGNNSAGIFAQSIGGSGGSGGDSIRVGVGAISAAVGVGGSGGAGGIGGDVIVGNTGYIETNGVISDGVFAQSIGGSGGSGGSATTGTIVFPVEIKDIEIPAISANVAVGGRGAGGGQAGKVTVNNSGQIITNNFMANGVFAQSVGGSGGRGGHATNISLSLDATFTGKVSVGGSGGQGGTGNTVTVDNSGLIHTYGDFSSGVFAQSIGGGGGFGGNATNVSLSLSSPPTSPKDFVPTPSLDFDLAIGGNGGAGSHGGDVFVTNNGAIITEGNFATGVMAQSVGGSGGSGGDARIIQVELTADPVDFVPFSDALSPGITMAFGGTGEAGGDGGDVMVTNISDADIFGVQTSGAFAHGIVAQSVGGGGGNGGAAMTFEFSNTDLMPDIPYVDEIEDLMGVEMTLQGNGGPGGNGGNVTLISAGNVITQGHFAMGVVGQSVAGGGGLAGFFNPNGITNNQIVNDIFNEFIDTDVGLSFYGSVGGAGDAGWVLVEHTGDIITTGVGAHGIFAQSAAGQGLAGNVDVTLDGEVYALGNHSFGVFAQSGGAAGNGDISLMLGDSIVVGGTGIGAGLFIGGGKENSIFNEGFVTSIAGIDGFAIRATGGDEFVENYGTMTGSVNLGGGQNYFLNYGLLDAGMFYDLGVGNTLLNEGHFAPGGVLNVFTTNFTGDFEQGEAGTLWYDLMFDYGLDTADWLNISGTSWFDGTLALVLMDTGRVLPGQHELVLISSEGGINGWNLSLDAPASAVITYSLMGSSPTDYSLYYDVDFAPSNLTRNQAALGEHINNIQLAGGTPEMEPLTASIVAIPDVPMLGAAYDMMSPHIYSANQLSRLFSNLDFEQSLHSCPVRDGDLRYSREGECAWMRASNRDIDHEASDGSLGGSDHSSIVNLGAQWALTPHWHGGVAVGFEKTDYEIRDAADRDGNQVHIGGILKGRYGKHGVNVSTTIGEGDFDTYRFVRLPQDDDYGGGTRDIRVYSVHAGYSYSFEREAWYFRPGLDIGWTGVRGDAFDERGAGPATLFVEKTDDTFVTSRLDFVLGGNFPTDGEMIYRPFLRAAYTHLHSGTTAEISARLAGAPDSVPNFTQVMPIDDNFATIATGIEILGNDNWMLRLEYDRQIASSWDSDAYFVKVMFDM